MIMIMIMILLLIIISIIITMIIQLLFIRRSDPLEEGRARAPELRCFELEDALLFTLPPKGFRGALFASGLWLWLYRPLGRSGRLYAALYARLS